MSCRCGRPRARDRRLCAVCLRSAALSRERRRRRALLIVGPWCETCGNEDPWVLEFDHVAGDGNAHRRAVLGTTAAGHRFVQWILANPREAQRRLRTLCANCHRRVNRQEICQNWREHGT